MADEEVQHRSHAVRSLPRQVRRLPAADPAPGRERIYPPKPLWLMRPLRLDEVRKYADSMEYEAARFYRRAAETARDASIRKLLVELADIEDDARAPRAQARRADPDHGCARAGGRDRAPHVRAAIRAAGPRRADGRLGLDAGAAVRRSLRHPQHLGNLPGRHGRVRRRRHLHGLCGSALRRRLAHRARHAVDARHRLRR